MSRWRRTVTAFGVVFVVSTLLTYAALMRVSNVFGGQVSDEGRWAADSLHQRPGRAGGPIASRADPPPPNDEAQRSGGRCSVSLTLLIPGLHPLKAWREYRPLWEEFDRQFGAAAPGTGIESGGLRVYCPRQRCDVELRFGLEEERLNRSDAIVVNMFPNILKDRLLDLLSHLRQVLHPQVHWIFYGLESPQMMSYWDPNIAEIRYHHSMTYHSQADVRLPYGQYLPGRPATGAAQRNWAAGKTSLAAWMASNCRNTFWPRLEFVRELGRRGVPVDVYGACGNLTCLPAMSVACTRRLSRYKFYLALENAECDEYVTEKVWSNALGQGAVPVVYGGRRESYERLLPPGSFVHAGDFRSAAELAAHLLRLDRDDGEYNRYHAWRALGRTAAVYPPLEGGAFCPLVPLVRRDPPPFRTVKDSGYFSGCKGLTGKFAEPGALESFVPWGKD